jgi:NADH-quinone oxidoreductase subunit I
MSCQICVEVCPFDAIKMDVDYDLPTDDRFGGLLFDKHRLSKSNEYYNQIHPTEAAAVDAHFAEERAKVEARAKAAAEAKLVSPAPGSAPPVGGEPK